MVKQGMTEQDFQDLLSNILDSQSNMGICEDFYIEEFSDASIRTFEDKGILTMNKGLVIRLSSGEEFQLTIVRSK